MYIYIHIYIVTDLTETSGESKNNIGAARRRPKKNYIETYVIRTPYIYIYIYVCMYVFIAVLYSEIFTIRTSLGNSKPSCTMKHL